MNLLFLLSDEHNKNIMGCAGHPVVKTPWMDGIADAGVRFPNAYCNNPICLPSRASFTTGEYASKHGYWDNAFPYGGEVKGFGHRLTEAGYPVVTIGKLHYKGNDPATGFPDQRIPLNARDGIGDVYSCARSFEQFRPELGKNVTAAHWGDSSYLRYDRGIADEAVRFLKEEANTYGKPWLLKVGFVSPHFPLVAPERYKDMYKLKDVVFPKRYGLKERPRHPILDEMRRYMNVEDEFSDEEVRRAVSVYYGMCSELDLQMGRVLQALKETGLDKTTRIIYTSDHGDMVGAQGLWWKHTFYEESIGVPFLMAGPDIGPGRTIQENISLVDLYPTILDCFGIELTEEEKKLPGRSLLPVVQGADKLPDDRPIFADYFAASSITGMYMIRKSNFKLCYYAYYPSQLFDMEKDPEETRDLAGDPAYASIIDDLEAELRKVVDPERTALRCRMEQLDKMNEYGGYRRIMKNGPMFAYSPVPKGFD